MQRIVFAVAIAAFISMGFAGSVNSSMSSFLHPFIGNGTATLAYYNASMGIVIAQVNGGYLAVSLQPYALVTNSVRAYPAFKAMMFQNVSVNFSAIGNLTAKVDALYGSSRPGFAACLKYTGLTDSYLAENSTKGCLSVSTCSSLLANQTLGPIAQTGIVNFSRNYNKFNSSYAAFNSLQVAVNQGNYYSYAGQLGAYASGIAAVPYALLHNPLFSPPANFTASLYKNCPAFPTAGTLQNFPWYCQMIRYCQNVGFNYANASAVETIAQQLQALPTNTSISAAASAAASLAGNYIKAAGKGNLTLFNEFMNGSSALVSEAKALSTKVSDPSLSSFLSRLNSTISSFAQSNYQNLTATERSISGIVSHLQVTYGNLSSQYGRLLNMSASLQSALLTAQLSNPGSAQLQGLESVSSNITTRLNTKVSSSDFNSIGQNLTSLSQQAASLGSPISVAAFVKSADAWFVWPLLSVTPGTVASKSALAPAYAAVLSLIIGLIALLVFDRATYHRLFRSRKVKPDKKAKRMWNAVFAIAIAVIAAYVAATYFVAASAGSVLPIQGFQSRLSSTSSVAIAIDGALSTNAVQQCAASLEGSLRSGGKTVISFTERNLTCVSGNSTNGCIDQFLASGIPVVVIGNGSTSYRGLYGYAMYANQSFSSGASCGLASLLR